MGECERRAQFDESFTPRCNGEDSFRQRTRAPRAGSFEPPSTQAAANARPTSAVYVLSHLAQPRRETSVGFMSSVVAARKLLRLCTCRWRGEDRERAGQDAPLKPLTSAPPPTHNELTVRLMSQPSRLSLCPKRCGRAHAAGLLMVLIHTPRPAPPRWRGARTTGRGVVYDRGGHTKL